MGNNLGYHRIRPVCYLEFRHLASRLSGKPSDALNVKLGHRRVSQRDFLNLVDILIFQWSLYLLKGD